MQLKQKILLSLLFFQSLLWFLFGLITLFFRNSIIISLPMFLNVFLFLFLAWNVKKIIKGVYLISVFYLTINLLIIIADQLGVVELIFLTTNIITLVFLYINKDYFFKKKKILFVCKGNVGRSQMAEAFYNRLTKTNDSWSAGTDGSSKKFKYASPSIVKVMSEKNIDVSKQKVKLVTEKMVENSERVFVMHFRDKCPEYLRNSSKVTFWENVEDPKGLSHERKQEIRDQIQAKIISLTN